ncbi:MAG TPA: HigA family addiction module antitoxin [Candidatus Acidoferrales bacterium]|jgi:addiction module HigA family antidote|nr:HigA family addiction module antitoxin [Candidatus Acidoferrales bacterium]
MPKKIRPVHPGEHLREDFLKPMNLSANRLAMDLHVPVTRIADILAGRRGVTSDTALRLARYFKTTPEFWMNMQTRYELDVAEDEFLSRIVREVHPREITATR